jgi:hypothetical protein
MKMRLIKKRWRQECDADPLAAVSRYGSLPLSVRRKLGRNVLARFLGVEDAGVREAGIRAAQHLPPAYEHPYGRKVKTKAT